MKVDLSEFAVELPDGPKSEWPADAIVTITHLPSKTRSDIPAAEFRASTLLGAIVDALSQTNNLKPQRDDF